METIKFKRLPIPERVLYGGKIDREYVEESIQRTQEKFKVLGGLAVTVDSNVSTIEEYEVIRPDTIIGKCVNITDEYIEINPRKDKIEFAKILSDNGCKARLRAVIYKKDEDFIFPRIIGFDICCESGDKDGNNNS